MAKITIKGLQQEIESLKAQLQEAKETLIPIAKA